VFYLKSPNFVIWIHFISYLFFIFLSRFQAKHIFWGWGPKLQELSCHNRTNVLPYDRGLVYRVGLSLSVVCFSLPLTRGVLVRRWTSLSLSRFFPPSYERGPLVRRWASLSLSCVIPSHLREGLWLDVGLVSFAFFSLPSTRGTLVRRWTGLSLSRFFPLIYERDFG
jgi:hypothetical protein